MDYQEKYLKYKSKYLELKNINNQTGGVVKNMFNKLKIIKKLGSGHNGEALLIKIKNKEYVLKRQKITQEEYEDNTINNRISREIEFCEWIMEQRENKIFFMKIFDYRKIPCNYDINLKNEFNNNSTKNLNYCFEQILEKKDNIFSENYNLLNKNDLLNGFIQCLNILNILHSAGYWHYDTKGDNIAFNYVKDKEIKIKYYGNLKTNIIFSLIDYGSILNKNNIYKDENLNKITKCKIDFDLYFLIEYFLLNNYELYKQINSWQHKKNDFLIIVKTLDTFIYDKIIEILKIIYKKYIEENIIDIIKDKNHIFFRIMSWEFLQILQIKYNNEFYKVINNHYKINAKSSNIINLDIIYKIKKDYMNYKNIFKNISNVDLVNN